jgi:hypothetical protein
MSAEEMLKELEGFDKPSEPKPEPEPEPAPATPKKKSKPKEPVEGE